MAAHLWYALLWLSFGAGHTLLASPSAGRLLRPVFGRCYRLAYNGFAVLHLAVVLWIGRRLYAGLPSFDLPVAVAWAGHATTLAGLGIIAVALAGYDRGRFLGTTQLRAPDRPADEPLRLDGLHRHVRHPLYSGLFLVLWGQAQTPLALATALLASVYLVLGTASEERKLVALHGERYRDYRRRVPAFVPWRLWRGAGSRPD